MLCHTLPVVFFYVAILVYDVISRADATGTYCVEEPVEQQVCQEGFSKINESSTYFVCQSPSSSVYKGSWYTVQNTTAVDILGSRWWNRGFFFNQVEVAGVNARGCFQKGLDGPNWIWFYNPEMQTNVSSNPVGSIEPDPVGSNTYEDWFVSFHNGSVTGKRGGVYVILPYGMEFNLRITGFVLKEESKM